MSLSQVAILSTLFYFFGRSVPVGVLSLLDVKSSKVIAVMVQDLRGG